MYDPGPLHGTYAAGASSSQHVLHRDYETRSRAILKTVGAQHYAADVSTKILCVCYAANNGPVKLWRPGDSVPAEFVLAAQNPNWIVAAFNDAFEAAIEKQIMSTRYGWPVVPIRRHRCTQAMCLALGLPARLSAAAAACELGHRKDAAGERLMHQTSKPRRARKDENPDGRLLV
jgi:DNA polymerase